MKSTDDGIPSVKEEKKKTFYSEFIKLYIIIIH